MVVSDDVVTGREPVSVEDGLVKMANFVDGSLAIRDGPSVVILARQTHQSHQKYKRKYHLIQENKSENEVSNFNE